MKKIITKLSTVKKIKVSNIWLLVIILFITACGNVIYQLTDFNTSSNDDLVNCFDDYQLTNIDEIDSDYNNSLNQTTIIDVLFLLQETDERIGELIDIPGGYYQIEMRNYSVIDEESGISVEIMYFQLVCNNNYTFETINTLLKNLAFSHLQFFNGVYEYEGVINPFTVYTVCEIMYASETLLSIKAESFSLSQGAGRVFEFMQTLNIALRTGELIRLSCIFNIDENFIKVLENNSTYESNPIYETIFKEYVLTGRVGDYFVENMIYDLISADGEDYWSIQSYLLEDRVGLIITTLNIQSFSFIILELLYDDLINNIRMDNDLQGELFPHFDVT